ncbi:hypothetical protein G7Y79_00006g019010 [Physcia stellaris]|nr:hypothetical protein G7Y79_00006g019010 [Physcia stellaris]
MAPSKASPLDKMLRDSVHRLAGNLRAYIRPSCQPAKTGSDTKLGDSPGIRKNGKGVCKVTKTAKRGHKSVESRMVYWKVEDGQISSLPPRNPFLFARAISNHEGRVARNRAAKDETIGIEHSVANPSTALLKAGDVGIFGASDELSGISRGRAVRALAATLYCRYHWLDKSTLANKLNLSRLGSIPGLEAELLTRITGDFDKYQTEIMDIYIDGVKETVASTGGLKAWKEHTDKGKRMKTFGEIFDSAPLDVAVATLQPLIHAVPLQDIWSDNSPDHVRWQLFHRLVFVETCELVYSWRLEPLTDSRKRCYKEWKQMTKSQAFNDLGIGGVDDIPISWAKLDGQRQQVPRVAEGTSL